MRQLTFIAPGRLAWQDVPTPRITGPLQAVVEPVVIARCDLDLAFVRGIVPMQTGTAIGHEAIGRVLAVGDGVHRFKPGDMVVVPAQISCGSCGNCRRGFTGRCQSVPFGAAFGMGREGDFGCLAADAVKVPYADAMLFPLPPGANPVEWIGFVDMAQDAWRAVAPQLFQRPDARVLVIGGMPQVIGLYAVAIAVALGAAEVVYFDDEPLRLAEAKRFGAQAVRRGDSEPTGQFEIVVDGHHEARSMVEAIRWVAPEGCVTSVTLHLGATTPVPLMEAYHKGVSLKLGRPNCRATMEHVCALCVAGRFRPHEITTRLFGFDDAPTAWAADDLRTVAARAF